MATLRPIYDLLTNANLPSSVILGRMDDGLDDSLMGCLRLRWQGEELRINLFRGTYTV